MWRLLGVLIGRRLVTELSLNLEQATDRMAKISIGLVFAQAGLLLAVFAAVFGLGAVFFELSDLETYVQPAWVTGLIALAPSLVCFLIARGLFRR